MPCGDALRVMCAVPGECGGGSSPAGGGWRALLCRAAGRIWQAAIVRELGRIDADGRPPADSPEPAILPLQPQADDAGDRTAAA
jgi:hypothetical protein